MTSKCASYSTLPVLHAGVRRAFGVTAAAAAGILVLGWSSAVSSDPLPKERCEALVAERALLEAGGADENILKGPEWGKAHLSEQQIEYVRRLIAVREDLLFRCREFDVTRDPPPPSAAPAAAPAPGRKPAPPVTTKPADGIPPPVRPERLEAKAHNTGKPDPGAAEAPASYTATEPKLRGTLPARTKRAADVPPPERKMKSLP